MESKIFSYDELSLKGHWKLDGTDSSSAYNFAREDADLVFGTAQKATGKLLKAKVNIKDNQSIRFIDMK